MRTFDDVAQQLFQLMDRSKHVFCLLVNGSEENFVKQESDREYFCRETRGS